MKKFKKVILLTSICLSLAVPVYASDASFLSTWEVNKLHQISKYEKIQFAEYEGKNVFEIINDDGMGNYSYVANEDIPKSVVLSTLNSLDNKVSLNAIGSGYSIGSSGSIEGPQKGFSIVTSFSTYINSPGSKGDLSDDIVEFSGTSRNVWQGNKPPKADQIIASDTFSFSYVGVSPSISVSYPLGAGGSVEKSNNSATLNYPTITNNYLYTHNYNNIKGEAFNIYRAEQTSNTTFLFGNKTYSTSAESEANINN